jgi:hypothetical protein
MALEERDDEGTDGPDPETLATRVRDHVLDEHVAMPLPRSETGVSVWSAAKTLGGSRTKVSSASPAWPATLPT